MKKIHNLKFRARRKDNGEWVEGNYFHNIRKGESHNVIDQDTNNWYEVYRDSLEFKNYMDVWVEADLLLYTAP